MALTTGAWVSATLPGCGSAPPGSPQVVEAPAEGTGNGSAVFAGKDPRTTPGPLAHGRSLPKSATYGDLVVQVRELLARNAGVSSSRCLLGSTREGTELAADLAPAVTPVSNPPADLDARLANEKEAFRGLSRWGQIGTTADHFVVALLTSTRPETAPTAVATVLTDRGVYVWTVGGDVANILGPVDANTATTELAARLRAGAVPVIVTAEAAVPVTTVHTWLASTEKAGATDVSLAVVLPEGTKIPEPVSTKTAPAAHCASGLPAAKDTNGELSQEEIVSVLMPVLERDAPACLAHGDASESRGGRVTIAARIGREGQVKNACIVESELFGSAVESCLIDAIQRIGFPSPKGGMVDVMIPVRLTPDDSLRQAAVCAPGSL